MKRKFAWLFLAAFAAGADASAPTAIACPEHDIAGTVRCMRIDVAENPARPEGRRLGLEVMVLVARAEAKEPDALFVIPGGPGQSATRAVNARRYFAEVFDGVRDKRDVVLIAPRGTAGSGELRLDPPDDLLYASLDTVVPPEWARAARRRLSSGADLRQYTTSNIADDLETVRQALAYARIDLYGTSYGTRVAQLYASRHPDRVRAMILKAPVPLDAKIPLTYTPGAERVLRSVFERCAADPRCAGAYPGIALRFDALMRRLKAAPAHAAVARAPGGDTIDIAVTDTAFGYLLRNLLMGASGARTVLRLIDEADHGKFESTAALIVRMRKLYVTELAGGMALSVLAAEDVPCIGKRELAADAASGFLRGSVARGLMAAAEGWPRGEAPADLFAPLRSDVPTLIIAGDLDPATPPEFAGRIAANLTNARVLVFAGGAHSAENFTGLDAVMSAFIEKADPRALDDSAAKTNRPLALVE